MSGEEGTGSAHVDHEAQTAGGGAVRRPLAARTGQDLPAGRRRRIGGKSARPQGVPQGQ